ncbi:hypothetical protein LB504_010542 [Fusarium proliferatum]|nr:hypothetical protein LB504_010542 [Fusarium proliferatum]
MVVVSVSVSEVVGIEPSVPGATAVPEGDSAGTQEPPAEDTYSSTVVLRTVYTRTNSLNGC